jgi:hypothetical protein
MIHMQNLVRVSNPRLRSPDSTFVVEVLDDAVERAIEQGWSEYRVRAMTQYLSAMCDRLNHFN